MAEDKQDVIIDADWFVILTLWWNITWRTLFWGTGMGFLAGFVLALAFKVTGGSPHAVGVGFLIAYVCGFLGMNMLAIKSTLNLKFEDFRVRIVEKQGYKKFFEDKHESPS